MKKHLLLIDALNLIRRIYAVDSKYHPDDAQTALNNAKQRVSNACYKLLKLSRASHAIAVFDGDKSWRYTFSPTYKENRKDMPLDLKNSLQSFIATISLTGIHCYMPEQDEADDVIATLAHKLADYDVQSTIVSTDKGFLPLLCDQISIYDHFQKHHMTKADVLKKFSVRAEQLPYYWAIAGDKTNGISGIKGLGKQSAVKLLNKYHDINDALNDQDLEENIRNKIEGSIEDYIKSLLLVSLRYDINLDFSLKHLRLN